VSFFKAVGNDIVREYFFYSIIISSVAYVVV
jgi:hypothetical protein